MRRRGWWKITQLAHSMGYLLAVCMRPEDGAAFSLRWVAWMMRRAGE